LHAAFAGTKTNIESRLKPPHRVFVSLTDGASRQLVLSRKCMWQDCCQVDIGWMFALFNLFPVVVTSLEQVVITLLYN
jgi:hypothetical protein